MLWVYLSASAVLASLALLGRYFQATERPRPWKVATASMLGICVALSLTARWWAGFVALVGVTIASALLAPFATRLAWRAWARMPPEEQRAKCADASGLAPLGPDLEGDDPNRPIPESWRERVQAYNIRRMMAADAAESLRAEIRAAGSVNAWIRAHQQDL